MGAMKDHFFGDKPYPDDPGYKREGTSKEAAESVAGYATALRGLVLEALAIRDGSADQVAERLGESVLSIRPRFSELVAKGLIERTGRRAVNVSGKMANIYRLVV